MIKRILIAIAVAVPFMASAQDPKLDELDKSSFGVWTSLTAEKQLNKRWAVDIDAELRTIDGVGDIGRWSVGAGAEYKINKWLKASAGYSLLNDYNYKVTYHTLGSRTGRPNKFAKFWGVRHRANLSLTGSLKVGHFGFSLRERYQFTHRPEKTIDQRYDFDKEAFDGKPKTYEEKNTHVLRSRLKVTYNIPKFPLTPFVSAEMYSCNIEKEIKEGAEIKTTTEFGIAKMRYQGGVEWKINKKHGIEMYYQYQDENDEDEQFGKHVLGVGYKFKF